MPPSIDRRAALARLAACGLIGRSALAGAAGQVTVYSSLDQEFSLPILDAYSKRTGVDVLPKFDVESTKTVGLTNLLITEARRPRCDLFWNNEILNTLRLKNKGMLSPYRPSHAAEIPSQFRAKDGTWYGFAARARVLLVNTRVVAETDRPKGIEALLDPRWKGKIGLAKPIFGTTTTHAACLFAAWGEAKAKDYYRRLKANDVRIFSGNKQVATAVGSGQVAFGLTDTDDAMGEVSAGSPVSILYPDRRPSDLGTLFIPNTLSILKNCPHPAAAASLADALLTPEVESALALGPGAQIPLLSTTAAPARVETPKTVHAMPADFDAAARLWDGVAAFLAGEFGR